MTNLKKLENPFILQPLSFQSPKHLLGNLKNKYDSQHDGHCCLHRLIAVCSARVS